MFSTPVSGPRSNKSNMIVNDERRSSGAASDFSQTGYRISNVVCKLTLLVSRFQHQQKVTLLLIIPRRPAVIVLSKFLKSARTLVRLVLQTVVCCVRRSSHSLILGQWVFSISLIGYMWSCARRFSFFRHFALSF